MVLGLETNGYKISIRLGREVVIDRWHGPLGSGLNLGYSVKINW